MLPRLRPITEPAGFSLNAESSKSGLARRVVMAPTINVIEEMALRLPRRHLRASCRDEDPGLFFLEKGHDYAEARKICATCSVFDDCLEEAVAKNVDDGIFAGA